MTVSVPTKKNQLQSHPEEREREEWETVDCCHANGRRGGRLRDCFPLVRSFFPPPPSCVELCGSLSLLHQAASNAMTDPMKGVVGKEMMETGSPLGLFTLCRVVFSRHTSAHPFGMREGEEVGTLGVFFNATKHRRRQR